MYISGWSKESNMLQNTNRKASCVRNNQCSWML